MNRESIRRFVREDLGCGCPEEVFDHVALASRDAGPDGPRHTRLLIGNRLLVYVMTASDRWKTIVIVLSLIGAINNISRIV